MRTSGVLVLCSLAFCAGTWLVVGGWRQPRPTLQRAMAHLHRPGVVAPTSAADAPDLVVSVGAFVEQRGASTWTRAWRQPLRLVGRSVETHVGYLVLASIGGLVAPSLILAILHGLGIVSIAIWVPAALSVACAVVLPLLVHTTTMAASAEVAVDLRHQLGAYLDMVTMLLAGNTGLRRSPRPGGAGG